MKKMTFNGLEFVDMGTKGVLWSTCNLGALSSEQAGDYFAWGEIETKDEHTKENWVHGTYDFDSLTQKDIAECFDEDCCDCKGYPYIKLNKEYDVVNKVYGGTCYIPTYNDYVALLNICDAAKAEINGVRGIVLTSRTTGNQLFFPFGGIIIDDELTDHGEISELWTSTAELCDSEDGNIEQEPHSLHLCENKSLVSDYAELWCEDYEYGKNIRPCMYV